MKILLLGGPGAGKGTQAKFLSRILGVPHVSTGDIFRENIRKATPLGLKVKAILDEGLLVPDELTNEIAKARLLEPDCEKGYILDGYPRTISQAEYLDTLLEDGNDSLDFVLNVDSSDDCIISRLSKRRSCPACGAVYHLDNTPPKNDGVCDYCGETLTQRADDKPETVRDRLDIYHRQTKPLLDHYSKKGSLINIDGERKVEPILEDILKIIGVK